MDHKVIVYHKENRALDLFKYMAALAVVGIHAMPLTHHDMLNLYASQCFFRFGVPLFLISSGYYFAAMDDSRRKKYIVRVLLLYLVFNALYLLSFPAMELPLIINCFVFGFAHLWYLNALVIGLSVICVLERISAFKSVNQKVIIGISLVLLLSGAFFDEYCRVFDIPLIQQMSAFIDRNGTSRHVLFFALPLLLIGRYIWEKREELDGWLTTGAITTSLGVCVLFAFGECAFIVRLLGTEISCDVTVFNWMPSVCLFLLSFRIQLPISGKASRILRKQADIIYIVHIWVMLALYVRGWTYWTRYFTALLICNAIGLLVQLVFSLKRKRVA